MKKIINFIKKRPINVALFLFALSFIFRLPTLFNDYYDVDELCAIVQTWQYIAGDIPGIDFSESKLPVYHSIFKFSYNLTYTYGWVIVHFITIIIIFLTSIFIYLTAKKLSSAEAGIYAGTLYAVLISSFNRMFMATNGELVYNLPVIAGLYALIMFFSYKELKFKIPSIIFFISCVFIAANVKFHGIILLIAAAVFFIIYLPYLRNLMTKKYVLSLVALIAISLLAFIIDYFTINSFSSALLADISSKVFYATAERGLNPLVFFAVFLHRQGMLMIWHFVLWVPAAVYVWTIIRNKKLRLSLQEGIFFSILVLTYALIFAGGARMYFHYYIAAYPALCIAAGIEFYSIDKQIITKLKNKFILFILIPGAFFFAWNTKDIILKYFNPEAFTNESMFSFRSRAVLTGAPDHYLLPDKSYSAAAEYIKNNTDTNDRIFVWGNGAYLYYFSERKSGIFHMWPKNTALGIQLNYKKNTKRSVAEAQSSENNFIKQLSKSNSVYFIDTSLNGLAGFNTRLPELMQEYVDKNYKLEKTINNILIYKKIEKK